jgi:hypothetical protein
MYGNNFDDVNLNNDPNFIETKRKEQQNLDKCLNVVGDVVP